MQYSDLWYNFPINPPYVPAGHELATAQFKLPIYKEGIEVIPEGTLKVTKEHTTLRAEGANLWVYMKIQLMVCSQTMLYSILITSRMHLDHTLAVSGSWINSVQRTKHLQLTSA